ncbi:MAG TPA: hypothetical protein ENI08_02170 [Candidatus Dependentiae bacterium]|nr:hypothetical protein [Candidatus Dependentiae bacterium]
MYKRQVQHNVPLFKGGKHEIENISIICKKCNSLNRDKVTDKLNNDEVVKRWNDMVGRTMDGIGKVRLSKVKPIRAKARTDRDGFFEEKIVERDDEGEDVPVEEEFKLSRGFHGRLAKYYMDKFNVPVTKGVYFTYKKYIDDMITLSKDLHGEDEKKIEDEITARIDVAKKYAELKGWGKVKLATILENWNIILDEWRKEVEL